MPLYCSMCSVSSLPPVSRTIPPPPASEPLPPVSRPLRELKRMTPIGTADVSPFSLPLLPPAALSGPGSFGCTADELGGNDPLPPPPLLPALAAASQKAKDRRRA